MEYIYYTLVVVALLGTLVYLARQPGEDGLKRRQAILAERAAERARLRRQGSKPARRTSDGVPQRRSALVRELKQVATPWGWPGSEVRFGSGLNGGANGQAMNGAQRPMQTWIGRLVTEKRTVEDSDYIQRRTDSLRAMVEDRFGRSATHTEIEFRPVRVPLLRDPNRPYDQMDNFPSGRTDRIVAKLQPQPRTMAELRNSAKAHANVPLRDVKTPWGW